MIHYYVQKGRLPSEIYSLSEGEKMFMLASMLIELEKKPSTAGICPLLCK